MKIRHWMLLMKDLKSLQKNKHTGKQADFKSPPAIYGGRKHVGHFIQKTEKILFPSCAAGTVYLYFCAGRTVNFGTIPNSFFSWNLIKGTHNWIGIKNFVDLVHDRDFIQSMFLTFKLAVVTIVLTNVLAFL